jgi:hypothetical protein
MMTGTDSNAPQPLRLTADELADRWRRLALYGSQVIDQALDASPTEARQILLEAAGELEAAIDELDLIGGAA